MGQICCCMQISQPKAGIKERWGKFDEVLEPGVHCVNWCIGKKVKSVVNLRLQQLDVKCRTKTKDNTFLVVVASIQYRVAPQMVNHAFYKLTDPRVQIRSFILDIITSTVPKMNINHVYENKDDISKSAAAYLQKEMSPYGLEIVKTLIVEIIPDESSKQTLSYMNRSTELGDVHTEEILKKLLNSFDAISEPFKTKDKMMQQRLVDIEERNAQLLERQVTLEKEQLHVAKESLTIWAQVEKQKTEAFTEVLNTLASSISGLHKHTMSL